MQSVTMTDQRKESYSYEESIKTLRTNIQFAGKGIQTILFTSCYPNEGKSDIAFQLAKEIGKMGKKVVLLDADIRKSSLISRAGSAQASPSSTRSTIVARLLPQPQKDGEPRRPLHGTAGTPQYAFIHHYIRPSPNPQVLFTS